MKGRNCTALFCYAAIKGSLKLYSMGFQAALGKQRVGNKCPPYSCRLRPYPKPAQFNPP